MVLFLLHIDSIEEEEDHLSYEQSGLQREKRTTSIRDDVGGFL